MRVYFSSKQTLLTSIVLTSVEHNMKRDNDDDCEVTLDVICTESLLLFLFLREKPTKRLALTDFWSS